MSGGCGVGEGWVRRDEGWVRRDEECMRGR